MRKGTYFNDTELQSYCNSDPIFNKDQMNILRKKTPLHEIETKTENGFTYKSIKASYMKGLVDMVTGGHFEFTIKSREFISASKEVMVEGRLVIWNKNRTAYSVREQFGQHFVKMTSTTEEGTSLRTYPSDIGNAYKAAASDAFKKCASDFGFCWDVYGQERSDQNKEDLPDISHADKKKHERLIHFLNCAKSTDDVDNVYNKFLETSEKTEASEKLYKHHCERFFNKND